MTAERRAEINRRLAEFEGKTEYQAWGDYTADLNALSRLEEKLPSHKWEIWRLTKLGTSGTSGTSGILWPLQGRRWSALIELKTEAEVKAEAIMQYLERHAESR